MGQILEVNTERRERLEAQGDFAIAPEQQLSDIWHKALRNPDDTTQQENSARASSRTNHLPGNKLRSPEGYPHRKQPGVDSSNINDSNGLRSRYSDRHGTVSEHQPPINGHQRIVNGCSANGHPNEVKLNGHTFVNGHAPTSNHHGPTNGHESAINGHSNAVSDRSSVNVHAGKVSGHPAHSNGYRSNLNGSQNGLYINKMVANGWASRRDEPSRPSGLSNGLKSSSNDRTKGITPTKENGNLEKGRQIVLDSKNGMNRSVVSQNAVNGRFGVKKEVGKDSFGISADLRQLLRPTVVQKRPEIIKVDYDPEDINGPYNFRQLLRPAEYLPTESLRKRKGGLACNGVPMSKDKVPEKHVKRRAPLAPNQNKFVNAKK